MRLRPTRVIGLICATSIAAPVAAAAPAPAPDGGEPAAVIVVGADATELERHAAAEVQRYLYHLTGDRLEIRADDELDRRDTAPLVVVGQPETNDVIDALVDDGSLPGADEAPGAEGYVVRTVGYRDRPAIAVMGSDDTGVLYGGYELLERYGARFYLGRDQLPDTPRPFRIEELDVTEQPAHERRGVLPWHNFLNGPSGYSYEDYTAYIDQLAKLKMNTLVLHNYADGHGGRPMNEPFLDFEYNGVGHDGWLDTSVSAREHHPRWGMNAFETGDMAFGSGDFFPYDIMGSDAARYTDEQPDAQRQIFAKAQSMMQRVIHYAQSRGMEIVLGTDFDVVPREIAQAGGNPLDPEILRTRLDDILATYPTLKYIQFHFHEHSTTPTADAIEALRFAHDYLAQQRPEARLVTGGWFQEQRFPEMDAALPADIIFSTLMPHNMDVRPQWSQVQEDREIWPIPWMEHDANLSEPQFGVSRMSEQLPKLRELEADGVFGILWRERPAEANVAYLAQDAWQPAGQVLPADEFYRDYATANFGASVADEAVDVFRAIEATGFPKTSGMTIEYGQWQLWGCCTEVQVTTWRGVKERFQAMRPDVTGPSKRAALEWYIAFTTWLERFWIAQQAPAPAEPTYERTVTLDSCDSIEGWTASGGHELVADPEVKNEGAASCSSTGPGADFFRKRFDPVDSGVSLETGVLAFWLYVSEPEKLGGQGQVELTSSGTFDQQELAWGSGAVVPYLSPGWNLVRLPFRAAGNTGGAPDLTQLDFFRLYLFPDEPVTLKIDDVRVERQVVPTDPAQRWEDLKASGFQEAIRAYQDMVADMPLQGGLASAAGGRWYGPAYQPLEREILDRLDVPPPSRLTAKGTPDGAALTWQEPQLRPPVPVTGDYYIDAGGPGEGDLVADVGFSTGSSAATSQRPVTDDFGYPAAMRTERWASRPLEYRLPAPPEITDGGRYRVELFFAENYFTNDAGGERIFDIEIDGELVEDNLDVAAAAGGVDIGIRRVYDVQISGDELVIRFVPVVSNPKVNIIKATRIDAAGNPLPPVEDPPEIDPDVAGYHVYRQAAGGEFERLTDAPVTQTSYRDDADGAYTYAVTAVRSDGTESPRSYHEKVLAGSADEVGPRILLIPRNLRAVAGEAVRVTAILPDGRVPDQVQATLHYRSLGHGEWQQVPMERNALARPYARFADIPADAVTGDSLEYYIAATDGDTTSYAPAGAPGLTGSLVVSSAEPRRPGAVPRAQASWDPDAGGVLLSWHAAAGAHQYNLYRSTDPDFTPSRASYVTYVPAGQTYFLDLNTAPGTTYHYKIQAETIGHRTSPPRSTVTHVPRE